MVRYCFLLSAFIGAVVSTTPVSMGLTLVRDGRSACTIVIAPDAGDQEKLAANELSTYLGKMSGAKVPIGSDASIAGNRILLGVFGQQPVANWNGKPPGPDAFAIETREREAGGTDLLLVGGDRRGAAYAVYELLERFLGVRWFMPAEMGEEVPVRKTIELETPKWSNKPDFEAIGGLAWAGGHAAQDWLRHNKGDVNSSTYFFGHSWSGFIAPSDENKKAHPDWFALNKDGTRSDQLCTSNPQVIQIFIDAVNKYFDQFPDADVASISPNDGLGFCTCGRCRAIDAQYGVTDGTQTDRFVHFANIILKEVKKKHPDKRVGILAYVSHTRPPVSAVPDPNYSTMICHTPWDFCHVHPINDPNCKSNTRFREMIEGWTKVCKHVSVYDYYAGSLYTPFPIVHNIRVDVPYLKSLGVQGFVSQTEQHCANQAINYYVAAKLVWDTDRNVDALLDEYYHLFYGPAEKPMRQYWEMWERAMAEQPCGGNNWQAMLTPERLEKAGQLLDEADRLVGDNDKLQQRMLLHRIGHRFTLAYTTMHRHAMKSEWQAAVVAGLEAVRIIEATAALEPEAFSLRGASDQTGLLMLGYLKKVNATKPAGGRPPGDVSVNPKDGAEMAYVPAGSFLMGSKEGEGSPHESPQHTVFLDDYWIYKFPVTVAQYRKFCEATGRKAPTPHHLSKDDHPVVNVSWEDAHAYAQWVGAALPTEAQWEKAARGTDGRIFPWGDSVDSVKRRKTTLNDEEQTKPIGSYPEVSSPYGVQDMSGHIWQWCADWYDANYYRNSPARNPTGPAAGTTRVLRGGRWFINHPNFFPATYRNFYLPKHWPGFCGFRCVMAPSAH